MATPRPPEPSSMEQVFPTSHDSLGQGSACLTHGLLDNVRMPDGKTVVPTIPDAPTTGFELNKHQHDLTVLDAPGDYRGPTHHVAGISFERKSEASQMLEGQFDTQTYPAQTGPRDDEEEDWSYDRLDPRLPQSGFSLFGRPFYCGAEDMCLPALCWLTVDFALLVLSVVARILYKTTTITPWRDVPIPDDYPCAEHVSWLFSAQTILYLITWSSFCLLDMAVIISALTSNMFRKNTTIVPAMYLRIVFAFLLVGTVVISTIIAVYLHSSSSACVYGPDERAIALHESGGLHPNLLALYRIDLALLIFAYILCLGGSCFIYCSFSLASGHGKSNNKGYYMSKLQRYCCLFTDVDDKAELYDRLATIFSVFFKNDKGVHLVPSDIGVGFLLVQGAQRQAHKQGHQFMVADAKDRWEGCDGPYALESEGPGETSYRQGDEIVETALLSSSINGLPTVLPVLVPTSSSPPSSSSSSSSTSSTSSSSSSATVSPANIPSSSPSASAPHQGPHPVIAESKADNGVSPQHSQIHTQSTTPPHNHTKKRRHSKASSVHRQPVSQQPTGNRFAFTREDAERAGHEQWMVDAILHGRQPQLHPYDWARINDSRYFAKYAFGAYGWPLYLFERPCDALCKCGLCTCVCGSDEIDQERLGLLTGNPTLRSRPMSTTYGSGMEAGDDPAVLEAGEARTITSHTHDTNQSCGSCCCVGSCCCGQRFGRGVLSNSGCCGGSCMNSSAHVFVKLSGVVPSSVLLANIESHNVGTVAYYVVIDEQSRRLVVATRGTLSIADVLTDLDSHVTTLECPKLLQSKTTKVTISGNPTFDQGNEAHGEGLLEKEQSEEKVTHPTTTEGERGEVPDHVHYAHSGITACAMWLRARLLGENEFKFNIRDYIDNRNAMLKPNEQPFSVVLCGHSLGAGVSTILAALFLDMFPGRNIRVPLNKANQFQDYRRLNQPLLTSSSTSSSSSSSSSSATLSSSSSFTTTGLSTGDYFAVAEPPLHAFAFAPPLTVDPVLAYRLRPFVTSVVYKNDVVCRLSLGNIFRLKTQMKNAFKLSKGNKFEIIRAGITSKHEDMFDASIISSINGRNDRKEHDRKEDDNQKDNNNSGVRNDKESKTKTERRDGHHADTGETVTGSKSTRPKDIHFRLVDASHDIYEGPKPKSTVNVYTSVSKRGSTSDPAKQGTPNVPSRLVSGTHSTAEGSHLVDVAASMGDDAESTASSTTGSSMTGSPSIDLTTGMLGHTTTSSSPDRPDRSPLDPSSSSPTLGPSGHDPDFFDHTNQLNTLSERGGMWLTLALAGRIYHIIPQKRRPPLVRRCLAWCVSGGKTGDGCCGGTVETEQSEPNTAPDIDDDEAKGMMEALATSNSNDRNDGLLVKQTSNKRRLFIYPAHPRSFDEIYVSGSMFTDHLPSKTTMFEMDVPQGKGSMLQPNSS